MVGSLNEQQSRGLALLKPGAIKRTIFNIKQPGTDGPGILSDNIAIELTSYQVKAKPSIKGKDIVMNISIKAKGNIIEDNSNHNTDEPQIAKAIEQAAAQALRRDIESCINQAQALNSDIMGWGLSISRSHPELWQEIEGDWPEIFAGIPSNIKVEFKLIQTYLQKDVFPLR
jgi:spore germination protein KC